ncbi:hypothetical protein COCOBI_12-4020 [Coccomyxa sp. Obi]|nr:hypothetical protein COCOBI_12-4020 [Coccomyxa sp. Obi]
MLLKEHEAATAAATAAGVDGSEVSKSHELAKQLFDDFMFEADATSASGPAAAYSPAMQMHQHSPGPMKRLRLWLASPFTRGGDVAELKATVSKLRQDICALKRLQRDAFEQLLRTSERLEDAEQDSGASDRGAVAGTTLLGGTARRHNGNAGTSGLPHVQVSGQLVYAREMVSLETGEGDAEYDEGHCLPPMMHIDLSTASQDSGSSLQAQLRINSQPKDGEAVDLVLHKVLYRWAVSTRLKLLCAVVNGRGDDVAATLNPQAGRGVTPLMRRGCTIHQKAAGEGLGFRFKGEDFTISGGHLRHTEDNDGDQSSTSMLQLDCSPSQQLALGLVAARHSSPPAPPSRRGDTTRSDSSRSTMQEAGSSSSAQGGHPQITNRFGITGAWRSRYDEVAVSGWMALSGARNVKEQDWGLAVSSIPMPNGEGWALAFGRGSWSCRTHSIPAPARPLMLEASLQFNAGGGLLLSPSLICTRVDDSLRAAVAVRSELHF